MVHGSRRFGAYLKALREARRLTLEDVERRTLTTSGPVSRSFLSRLEHGRAHVSAARLIALARLYRVRVGLLAERLELDQELEQLRQEGADRWEVPVLFSRARQAGQAGQLHRALLLYEQAELRSMRDSDDARERHRARLGVARALAAGGRHRLARAALEDMLGERLSNEARAWAFFFFARTSLALGQMLIARAAHLSLKEVARPWPLEIEAAAPTLEGEYLVFEGRTDEAFEAFIAALDAARRACEKPLESLCLCRLAEIERRRGRLAQALDWAGRARDLAQAHGVAQMVVQAETEAGRIHAARKRTDLAREAWARGRQLARRFDLAQELFDIYLELWRLGKREGTAAEAHASLRCLRQLSRTIETLPADAADLVAHWQTTSGSESWPAGPRSPRRPAKARAARIGALAESPGDGAFRERPAVEESQPSPPAARPSLP